jgi:hypothetical protein
VLDEGHEQRVSSLIDGWRGGLAEMPHSSPWPLVLAVCLSLVFTMLVIEKFVVAGIMGVLCLLTLVAWHSKEPQE